MQNQTIGYWPDSIFTTLANGSDALNWGGEIINDEPEGHHTLTQMGSGHFSSEGYGKACYFHNLKYMDDAGVFKDPGKLIPYVTKPLCYDLQVGEDTSSEKGTFFYFGGPGYSKICLLDYENCRVQIKSKIFCCVTKNNKYYEFCPQK